MTLRMRTRSESCTFRGESSSRPLTMASFTASTFVGTALVVKSAQSKATRRTAVVEANTSGPKKARAASAAHAPAVSRRRRRSCVEPRHAR